MPLDLAVPDVTDLRPFGYECLRDSGIRANPEEEPPVDAESIEWESYPLHARTLRKFPQVGKRGSPQFLVVSVSTCDDVGTSRASGGRRMSEPDQVELREVMVKTGGVPLGEDIRLARERLQMTQPQLAEAVGVSESTVSNWERGVTSPKNRLGLVRQVLRMDETDDRGQDRTEGPLLRDASMGELLDRIHELYNEALRRRPQSALAYQPGAPDPDLIAGPTTRSDRTRTGEDGAASQA